ncbi:peptidase [Sinirhodobacter populi]|uniref:Peptidase n=1 Tax=Paenirhodobacter populi TaxID=2306993 RepID=A0A443K938_9RHOB|nr:peptidase [Sinirhodobacter populi]RWR29193.1 peptidase [Sinirhodobacter populi]
MFRRPSSFAAAIAAAVPATPDPAAFGPIEIFRAGSFADMTGTTQTIRPENLTEIAGNYDPENHPAPVVIGHPETDAPAFGWVDQLYVEGDVLKAMIKDAAPEFVDMVKAGRYKRVSISLFLPASTANPMPGELYIRHVGFLGAQAPAVPGLKPVKFAGGPGSCFAMAQDFAAPLSPEQAELAALRREKTERRVEDLIRQGRVLPRFKDEIMSFADSLGSGDTVSFADGSAMPTRDWFFDYLSKQPVL